MTWQSVVRVLFMGEHLSWSRVLQALEETGESAIRLYRVHLSAEALQSLEAEQWDAILVAISPQSTANLDVIRAMRAKRQRIPLLVLVPDADEAAKSEALEAGATECLPLARIDGNRLRRTIFAACWGSEIPPIVHGCSKAAIGATSPAQAAGLNDMMAGGSGWIEVCHTLNNLLCVISGSAEILAERLADR